jgi:hypothetical protein
VAVSSLRIGLKRRRFRLRRKQSKTTHRAGRGAISRHIRFSSLVIEDAQVSRNALIDFCPRDDYIEA